MDRPAICDAFAAAARYLSTSDYKGKVMLTGLGTPNQMREYVEDGTVEVTAGGDGFKSDQTEDATQGYLWISAGDITVDSGGDAFDAATDLVITGGDISATSGGGASAKLSADASAKALARLPVIGWFLTTLVALAARLRGVTRQARAAVRRRLARPPAPTLPPRRWLRLPGASSWMPRASCAPLARWPRARRSMSRSARCMPQAGPRPRVN